MIAYKLFAGRLPFDGDDLTVLGQAVLNAPVPKISTVASTVNAALAKALAKKPEERFTSCGAFVGALEGRTHVTPKRPFGKIVAVAVFLALLSAGGLLWMKGSKVGDMKTPKAGDMKTVTLPGGAEMMFRWCPPGLFTMGSPRDEDERDDDETQHRVTLTKGFWMGETEVTQEQWKNVMGTTVVDQARKALLDDEKYGGKTVREWLGKEKYDDPATVCGDIDGEVAMYYVSWNEAKEFCDKLTARERAAGRLPEGWSYRLPTEAQWEYACRAGTDAPLPNGRKLTVLGKNNAPALDDIAWYGGNSSVGFSGKGWDTDGWKEKQYPGGNAGPRRVGLKEKNRFGLYDMIGNVCEWCEDCYDKDFYSQVEAMRDPCCASGGNRVLRGGGWSCNDRDCRSAVRAMNRPGLRHYYHGFRLLCSAGPHGK